jgi:hypothetical protein
MYLTSTISFASVLTISTCILQVHILRISQQLQASAKKKKKTLEEPTGKSYKTGSRELVDQLRNLVSFWDISTYSCLQILVSLQFDPSQPILVTSKKLHT